MSFLENTRNKLFAVQCDLYATFKAHTKQDKIAFGSGIGLAMMQHFAVLAFAANTTSVTPAGFASQIKTQLANIYAATATIATVVAALAIAICFIARMTSTNPQSGAKWTGAIKTILLCYLGFNCIGIILSVIDSISKGMSFPDVFGIGGN